ncbi:hypothetical protein C8Q69DRAFT_106741 [Paecilomyces variotii]|uniref:Uncharacterized protein n=1 Tax=Byssochlamys spectabilis TaxID=264951 RepID=A0A443HK41_BYSSP|nr:hypothetical protein C8Q69DRAFT_106741 [Paecilomyces variotii]RWQ92213.1 hypothetical protein C8Q69DRAFT_106741 [Paecilomyces variotii]
MIDRETRLCCFGRGEVCWLNAEVQGIRKRMVRQGGAGHGSTSCHCRPMSSRFETWTSWSSGAMFGSQCRAAMCQTEHQHAWCTVYICGRMWTAGWTTLHGTMGFSGVISLLLLQVYGVVCALPTLSVAGIIYVHYSHLHRLKYFGVMPKKVSNKPPSIEKIVPSPSKKKIYPYT